MSARDLFYILADALLLCMVGSFVVLVLALAWSRWHKEAWYGS